MFKNIFENYPKIPEGIKRDPDKIIDYVNSQEKAKNVLKNLDKDGASTIVGAKEDYDHLGYKQTEGRSLLKHAKRKRRQNGHERFNECYECMIFSVKKVYKYN